MLNKVTLIGRLGRDPEVRYMPNGDAACNFSVATDESWKTPTERFPTWNKSTT